jgi:hypothetical protein
MAVSTLHLINNDVGAQTVKTRATDVFHLQAFVYPKVGNTGGGTLALALNCTDSRGINGATTVTAKSLATPATGAWVQLDGYATVPTGYDTVDPVLTLTSVPVTDTIYVDDLLVREVTYAQNVLDQMYQSITGTGTTNNSLATLGTQVANWINKLFGTTSVQNTVTAAAVPALDASKITTGALAAARVGALPASQITSGTFASTFVPMLGLQMASQSNLVIDPGFENTTYWANASNNPYGSQSTDFALSGTHSWKIPAGASQAVYLTNADNGIRRISTRPGEIFQIQAWYYQPAANANSAGLLRLAINLTDSTAVNAAINAIVVNLAVTSTVKGAWTLMNGYYTVPAGYDTVLPFVWYLGATTGDLLYVDNALFREATLAQSTIAALFSGGAVASTILPAAVPSLDASKITTGTFAQTFVSGLTSLWNSWFGTTTPTGASTLNAANVAPLDASKITTGTFAQSFVSGLQSLWSSWFGTTTPTGTSTLNAANVAPLDASKVTTGIFGTTQIPNLDVSKIVTTDPYWASVVALLHGNGINGSTTFTDDSPLSTDFTVGGTAAISTAQSKFGGSSMTFPAATDYIAAASAEASAFAFGTGDFTIETWVYATATMANNSIYDSRPGANGAYPTIWMTTGGKVAYYTGTLFRITAAAALSLNAWHHIAAVRSSGITTLYVDGVSQGTYTDANNYVNSAGYPTVGNGYDRTLYHWAGYIDELRVTKGVARYTANFTTPATAFATGALDTTLIPPLDASQIITGTFAQSFVSGLQSLWNSWFGTTTPTGASTLNAANVAPLDASKITTGTFAQSFVSGLTSLWNSWFGTPTPTGASTLNAANVAPLDASKITTGTFAQSFVSGLQSLWSSWFGTTTPTGTSVLNAANIATLDASKIVSGSLTGATVPGGQITGAASVDPANVAPPLTGTSLLDDLTQLATNLWGSAIQGSQPGALQNLADASHQVTFGGGAINTALDVASLKAMYGAQPASTVVPPPNPSSTGGITRGASSAGTSAQVSSGHTVTATTTITPAATDNYVTVPVVWAAEYGSFGVGAVQRTIIYGASGGQNVTLGSITGPQFIGQSASGANLYAETFGGFITPGVAGAQTVSLSATVGQSGLGASFIMGYASTFTGVQSVAFTNSDGPTTGTPALAGVVSNANNYVVATFVDFYTSTDALSALTGATARYTSGALLVNGTGMNNYVSMISGDQVGAASMTFGATTANAFATYVGQAVQLVGASTNPIAAVFNAINTSGTALAIGGTAGTWQPFPASSFPTTSGQINDTVNYTYNASTNTVTIKNAGLYFVCVGAMISSLFTSQRVGVGVAKNGTIYRGGLVEFTSNGTAQTSRHIAVPVYCQAGDTISPMAMTSVATSVFVGDPNGVNTYFSIALMSRSLL